ncbi:MAG: RNA polymerase sporulation sigma factor SigG [Firmicutes bacterium]|nr:RNA polymerase sporulation sigma factor SigG [Bacillota bacterium]HOB34891.1 RNA polymerase sporulation sigma factor SigG [Bacillota bacterium]HPZ91141.1 RNA polymerase sporulation sigma factor SigG [Bacillota bacterium]HQE02002.1 RNA polymerase sporulation sigma factor SigG [Bacillota bacterium]
MQNRRVTVSGIDTFALRVLSAQEMDRLFQQKLQGNKEAREKIIRGNLRLVLSVLKQFHNRGENIDDLFQVGCVGLVKAVDNFDPGMGVRFSTYAVPMILGEIRRYLRDNNVIRVSRSLRRIAHKALQAREQLAKRIGREPTIEEIAASLELPPEEVVHALDANFDPISLHESVYNDSTDPLYLMDQIRDAGNDDTSWMQKLLLKEALDKLSPREKEILHKRFMVGMTQVQVARLLGISQAQVSRLEKGALSFIKKHMGIER